MRDNICSSKRCRCVEKKHNCILVSDCESLIMCRIIIHAEGISSSNNYNIYNTCISCIGYYQVDIYDKVSLMYRYPAVFVPKRYIGGWTVNFGHPLGKLIMSATLILAVVLLLSKLALSQH